MASSPIWGWQSEMHSLVERHRYLLEAAPMSDVTFLVGYDIESAVLVKAHKFILATGSLVFETMFYGSVPERTDVPVRINDVDVDIFRMVLRFIYLGEEAVEWENIFALLYASKKYGLSTLTQKCVDYVSDNVKPSSCIDWICQIQKFDQDELLRHCLGIFDTWSPLLVKRDNFLQADADTLRILLKRDSLLAYENDVYSAVERWAHTACLDESLDPTPENRRRVLGDIFYLVRFSTMAPEEIMNGPAKTELLTKEETYDIFRQRYTDVEIPSLFNKRPRCLGMLARFKEWKKGWIGPEYAVGFKVDAPVKLAGVGVFGADNEERSEKVSVKVEICRAQHSGFNSVFPKSVVASEEFQYQEFGSADEPLYWKLQLKEPVSIAADVYYGIGVYFQGVASKWQGINGRYSHDLQLPNGAELKILTHAYNPHGSYVFDQASEQQAYENGTNGPVAHLYFENL